MTLKIALCFWGMNRSAVHTHESIRDKIYQPLIDSSIPYDTYGHFNHVDHVINSRTGEHHDKLSLESYKLLLIDALKIDDQEKLYKQLKVDNYRSHPDPWKTNYESVNFFIFSLFSLLEVTNMMSNSGKNYSHVIFLRPDVKYIDQLPVSVLTQIKTGQCAIPDFTPINTNDRFSICSQEDAIILGNRFNELLNYSKKNLVHAESFLDFILYKNKIKVKPLKNFLFQRIRANGEICKTDLMLYNKYYSNNTNHELK